MDATTGAITPIRTNLEDERLLASDDTQVFSVTLYDSRTMTDLTAHDIQTSTDVVLRTTSESIIAVDIDATHVYWIESDQFFTTNGGTIYRTLKNGTGPVVPLVDEALVPFRLRLAGDYIYWTAISPTDYVGTVNRRRK